MFIHFLKISNFLFKEFKKISLKNLWTQYIFSSQCFKHISFWFNSVNHQFPIAKCIKINCILLIFLKPNHYFKFHTSTSYNAKQRGTIIGILSCQLICIFQTYINYSLIATLSAWIRLRLDSSYVVNQWNI